MYLASVEDKATVFWACVHHEKMLLANLKKKHVIDRHLILLAAQSESVYAHISVAKVQFRTDAENQNWQNQTESSVQFSSGSPFLATVQFSVLRILQNSQTVWEPLKFFTWNAKKVKQLMCDVERL